MLVATPRTRNSAMARLERAIASGQVLPRAVTFTKSEFDFATLEHRLRELAFLNSGVRLFLTDARGVEAKTIELHYEGGVEAFVRYLDRNKTAVHQPPIVMRGGDKDGNADATRYIAPSGATVFASGSHQFAWGLDDFKLGPDQGHLVSHPLQRFMQNAFNSMTH